MKVCAEPIVPSNPVDSIADSPRIWTVSVLTSGICSNELCDVGEIEEFNGFRASRQYCVNIYLIYDTPILGLRALLS